MPITVLVYSNPLHGPGAINKLLRSGKNSSNASVYIRTPFIRLDEFIPTIG